MDRNLRTQSQIVNVSAFSVELTMAMPIGDTYTLPVVTGGAEPQEDDGIARALIKDAKIHPGDQCPNDDGGYRQSFG